MVYIKLLQMMALIVSAGLVVFSVGAYAAGGIADYKKPMPKLEMLSDEDYQEQFITYNEVPQGDQGLAYSVDIPHTWEKITDGGMSTFNVNSKIFGEVARFYSPARLMGDRDRFSVQVIGLEHQLTAEQWLLQYILKNGYSIQAFEEVDEYSAEALFVLIDKRISYIVRAKASVNGGRVLLAQYFLPMDNWDEGKVTQAHTVKSFVLNNRQKDLAEEMIKFRFLDVAEIYYPTSWNLRSQPMRSIDIMKAKILNISSQVSGDNKATFLNGKVDIKLVSKFAGEHLEKESKKFKAELEEGGISFRDEIPLDEKFKFDKRFSNAKVQAFKAVDSNEASLNYEVWVSSFSSGEYYYLLSLLTPTRDADFNVWSRNTQSFKLILEHVRPLSESITGR